MTAIAPTRVPYADGIAGVHQSLDGMKRQIRADRGRPEVKGWAQTVLGAAGLDGRDHPSVKAQAQALLEALRKRARYWPDPAGLEYISSASAVLCLTKENCVNGEDCDGLTAALCSAMSSVGLNVCIFLQDFGPGMQQHVLAGVQDESGQWLYADPTLKDAPVGTRANGVRKEWRIDPFDAHPPTGLAAEQPGIVTFGKAPSVISHNGRWWHWSGDHYMVHNGKGWEDYPTTTLGPRGMGATILPYQTVTDGKAKAGLRYRIGMQVTFNYDPTAFPARAKADLTASFPDFAVESVDAQDTLHQNVDGTFYQGWILQGLAKVDTVILDKPLLNANTYDYTAFVKVIESGAIKILLVGVQASVADPNTPPVTKPAGAPPAAPDSSIGVVGALLFIGVVAVGGGLAWRAVKKNPPRMMRKLVA